MKIIVAVKHFIAQASCISSHHTKDQKMIDGNMTFYKMTFSWNDSFGTGQTISEIKENKKL